MNYNEVDGRIVAFHRNVNAVNRFAYRKPNEAKWTNRARQRDALDEQWKHLKSMDRFILYNPSFGNEFNTQQVTEQLISKIRATKQILNSDAIADSNTHTHLHKRRLGWWIKYEFTVWISFRVILILPYKWSFSSVSSIGAKIIRIQNEQLRTHKRADINIGIIIYHRWKREESVNLWKIPFNLAHFHYGWKMFECASTRCRQVKIDFLTWLSFCSVTRTKMKIEKKSVRSIHSPGARTHTHTKWAKWNSKSTQNIINPSDTLS